MVRGSTWKEMSLFDLAETERGGSGLLWLPRPREICSNGLEGEPDAKLGGERDADSGAGAEEVSKGPGRDKQLLATRDRHGEACVRAKCCDVREIVYGN